MSTNFKIAKVNVYTFDGKTIYAKDTAEVLNYLDEVSNVYGAEFEKLLTVDHEDKYIIAKTNQLNRNTTIQSDTVVETNNAVVVEDAHLMFNGFFNTRQDAENKLDSVLVK